MDYTTIGYELCPAICELALDMQKKLDENQHKSGWSNCSFQELFARLKEEADEAEEEFHKDGWSRALERELADVANFAMMLHDICRKVRLEDEWITEEEIRA